MKTQPTNSPRFDVVLASRKDTAVKLFEKANPVPKVEAPATLFDMLGSSSCQQGPCADEAHVCGPGDGRPADIS